MNDFGERLSALRKKLNLTQSGMAAKMGLSMSYIHQLEAGKRTPSESVETIVRMLQMQMDAGLLEEEPGNVVKDDAAEYGGPQRTIPVLGWAHAGAAQSYEEIPKSWQERLPTDCRDPNAFAVKLEGDSMAERYEQGDILFVSPSAEPYSGCLAICKFANDGLLFRRVEFYPETVRLVALNPSYPPTEHPRSEFSWIYPVFGRWTAIWKK